MGESELWRRVAEDGDARALGDVFELHADRLFRHAARLAGDRRDAEDAVAVAFLELWRRRAAVRVVDGSPLPWLLATTTNALRNLNRSAARYRRLVDALPRDRHAQSAEDEAFGDEHARVLLEPLGTIDRQLITLVWLEGFSGDEAAAALGMRPGAVRTRLSRARARLRGLNEPFAVTPEEAT